MFNRLIGSIGSELLINQYSVAIRQSRQRSESFLAVLLADEKLFDLWSSRMTKNKTKQPPVVNP